MKSSLLIWSARQDNAALLHLITLASLRGKRRAHAFLTTLYCDRIGE